MLLLSRWINHTPEVCINIASADFMQICNFFISLHLFVVAIILDIEMTQDSKII